MFGPLNPLLMYGGLGGYAVVVIWFWLISLDAKYMKKL